LAIQARPEKPDRFAREKYYPNNCKPLLDEFLALFHRYGYIYKPVAGGSWLSANDQWKLTDTEILKAAACAHPKHILGARSGKSTRFAVLDIDANSKYHNIKSLDKIRAALAAGGIKETVVYRSSHSDGWHLYIFFDELIGSADLRQQLVSLLQLNGFALSKGTLEVFPAPGAESLGQGLRLPLQPGWAWLDQKTLDVDYYREEVSPAKAIEWFLEQLHEYSNSYTQFRILKSHVAELEARKQTVTSKASGDNVYPFPSRDRRASADPKTEVKEIFSVLPPGINTETWWRGRCYYESGLTGASQRADAIFCLGHYLFYGDPSQGIEALGYGCHQEREWAINEILDSKHNGYSKDILRRRKDATEQVERATRWLPPEKRNSEVTKYTQNTPVSWIRNNAKRSQDARKRIEAAVQQFQAEGQRFSIRDLKVAAKCSEHTLYKHEDLWKVTQQKLQSDRFESVADEYNAVVGVGCPKTQPPSTVFAKDMPPGRLAARRILFEMNRRDERNRRNKEKSVELNKQEVAEVWRTKVADICSEEIALVDDVRLKALVTVLGSYLMHAPYEEDCLALQAYMTKIREELRRRTTRPSGFVALNDQVNSS
jgi:hypothetical protein